MPNVTTRRTLLAAGCLLLPALPAPGQSPSTQRVGIYDSRAIAVAYARSDMFRQWYARLNSEHDKAKAASDDKRAKELEAQGVAQQERFHQQGFGTASVADIMEKIKAELPAVAKEAGVGLIVSKWEVIYHDPTVECVDVTIPLVKKFGVDTKSLQMIEHLIQQAPIPAEELVGHQR
jgi:hypothetical protein